MTKIISISDSAYEELKKLKNGMSFSRVILDIVKMMRKDSIMDFAGKLGNKEALKLLEEIKKERKAKSRRME